MERVYVCVFVCMRSKEFRPKVLLIFQAVPWAEVWAKVAPVISTPPPNLPRLLPAELKVGLDLGEAFCM